jgi:zinc transport system substrate-binding protein
LGRRLDDRVKTPRRTFGAATFALLVWLIGIVAVSAAERLHIVTSFFPIYSWTKSIAGDRATVENLLPPRAEPHEYAFTPGDARKLARADLIVINGLGLESWVPKFLRNAPEAAKKIVTTTAGLEEQLLYGAHHHHHGHDHDHDHGAHAEEQPNEHVWLDPTLAAHGVSNILAALRRADPANANFYASNAQAYVARLHQLDSDIRAQLAGVTNRAIVTYHDAFPYFVERYGLEIAGVVEETPEVNPTPKYLARLGRTIRERGIGVIFIPPGADTRLARRIAADLRVKLVELDTLESGPLAASAYEERMRYNAAALQQNLK